MILITGDTHGDVSRFKNDKMRQIVGDDLSVVTHSIILGDFGLVWNGAETREERYWLNWLDEKPYETLVVLGNHENYERIYNLPIVERYGAPMHQLSEKVFIFKHGYKYTIEDKTFFVFGGADSIDKEHRASRITWWNEEIPTVKDLQRGLDTCEENNYTFDYVLTHTAPTSALLKLREINPSTFFEGHEYYELKGGDPTTKMLQAFVSSMNCKRWYFGHFHDNTPFTVKGIDFSLLFYKVEVLK